MKDIFNESNLFMFVIVPLSFILPLLITYLVLRSMGKKLKPIAAALGGELIVSLWRGTFVRLNIYGGETRIQIRSGGQNSPPYLEIKQYAPVGFKLTISEENIATKKLSKWGLIKDVKVGEPFFDDKYLVRSNEEMKAQNYLQDSERREAVEYFFSNRFDQMQIDGDSVMVRMPRYKAEDLDPDLVGSHLEKLQKLTSG